MRANSAKTRKSAIGLIALVAIGCVQNRQARVEKPPLTSEQGGWIRKFPYLTSNSGRQSVFDDPSEWPARPPEEVVQTRFAQLFPNLSRRSSGRVAPSPENLAETPVESNASLDALAASETPAEQPAEAAAISPESPPADAAVASAEPTPPTVSEVTAEPVRSTSKVDWATLSANSAGVASVVAALAAVSDTEVVSATEVRAETSKPEVAAQGEAVVAKPANVPQSASNSPEPAAQVSDQSDVATPPVAAEPVVQMPSAPAVEPVPGESVTAATAPAVVASSPNPDPPVAPATSDVVSKSETPRSPLTAVQADDLPAALPPAAEVASESKSSSVMTPNSNSAQIAEPVAQSEVSASKALEIPGIAAPIDKQEAVTEQAKAEQPPAPEPVPQVAIRKTAPATPVPASPAVSQPVAEPSVAAAAAIPPAAIETSEPMPEIPAIPADEVKLPAGDKSLAEAGQRASSGASPALADRSAASEVPPIPAAPAPEPVVPGLPATEPVVQADEPAPAAPVVEAPAPPAIPARSDAEARTLEIPGVPVAAPAAVPEPSKVAVNAALEPPVAEIAQRPETANASSAPAPAELPGTLSEPPPPAPAPELQVPGVSDLPVSTEPAAKPSDQPSPADAGVERSSGAAVQAATLDAIKVSDVPTNSSSEAEKTPETEPAASPAEGADTGDEIPVLQPLPDDETTQHSADAGSAIERKPGELVIHLRLSNPFRLNRFRSTPDDQPAKVSTTRGLKSAARSLFTWQRGSKADSADGQVDSDLPATTPAPEAVTEPASGVADKPEDTRESQGVAVAVTQTAVEERVANEVDPAVATQSHTEPQVVETVANAEPQGGSEVTPEDGVSRRTSRIAAFFVPGRTQAVANPTPPRTSNGLPAVEFPASYHATRPRSANPWYAHAKPAVNPLADPRRDMVPVTAVPATSAPALPVTKTESKPTLRPDLEIVRTSLNVPAASTPVPAVNKPETPKDQSAAKASSSWWSNSGKSLRRMVFGEEEVVPAKRPNWATRQTSGR